MILDLDNLLFKAQSFISHFIYSHKAGNIEVQGVSNWYEQCVRAKQNFEVFNLLNLQSQKVLLDTTELIFLEMGAKKATSQTRTTAQIARTSSSHSVIRETLFKTVLYFKPINLVEIGSSLGLTSQYLFAAMPQNAELTLMDGNFSVLNHAEKLCHELNINKKLKTICGNFDQTLAQLINQTQEIDFVYFDGNHTFSATMSYFHQVLQKASKNAILVFDDIYWNKDMNKAWQQIIKHPKLNDTVDMFYTGFCFMGEKEKKNHFRLRYSPAILL